MVRFNINLGRYNAYLRNIRNLNLKNKIKSKLINIFRNNPNRFILLLGCLLSLVLDLLFYRTIYIKHAIFGSLLLWITMFIYGFTKIVKDILSNVAGCCDFCQRFISVNETCFRMINLKNKSLQLQFCNKNCFEKAIEKHDFINSLLFTTVTLDKPVQVSNFLKVITFMILCPWSVKMDPIKLLEYIICLRFKDLTTKGMYTNLHERFILYMVDKLNVA